MPLSPDMVLGRYRLIEKAGSGGMSEVWKAEDQTLHRTVAVKVIHSPVAADPTYRERFLREARLVAGLEHPHVLPVYDFGTAAVQGEEISYLVMPFVSGGSLKDRITGPMPYPLVVAWLSAVAAALDHAHASGILHRDVKPANVLLDSHDRPLLADFGLARTAESASGLTATGTVLGTPLYMSPEQATGAPLDPRADQYALAVIAFELLTGRVPFRADSPLAVLHQHVAVAPAPISSALPDVPKGVDAVMARALAKEPARRFPSCGIFVTALAEALGVSRAARTAAQAPTAIGPDSDPANVATVVSARDSAPPSAPLTAPASAALRPAGSTTKLVVITAFVVIVSGSAFLLYRSLTRNARAIRRFPAPAAETPSLPKPTGIVAARLAEIPTAPPAPAPTPAPAVSPAGPIPPPPPAARGGRMQLPRATAPPAPPSLPDDEEDVGDTGRARAPRRQPLLRGKALAADTGLAEAWEALDDTRRADGRLRRADFVEAMGSARRVLASRPTRPARFLDSFSRAGVAFADGKNAEAWQLLRSALGEAPEALEGRTLRFVSEEAFALGPNPGADAGWVMGLAFSDVRGDLAEEIEKAGERAPGSARVLYARSLFARAQGRVVDAKRYAMRACASGLRRACQPGRR